MRPIYENDATKKAELETIRRFAEHWGGVEAKKLPIKSKIDWLLLDLETKVPVAWVECKKRGSPSSKFDTYMISFDKWHKGLDLEGITGKNFLLVVEFTDGIYWCRPSQCVEDSRLGWGGRDDRKDDEDFEPMMFIGMAAFRRLE